MPLPKLTDSGELPVGVHQASLRDTLGRFGVGIRSGSRSANAWNEFIGWPWQPGTWLDLSFSGHS